eukprot:Lankesteria_metandrocarpae@DN5251_c0_g1_i4.p2
MTACQNLGPPNQLLSNAVDVRQEIDLRLGAAFTRLLTLRYKARLNLEQKQIVSYGPCQFPTLGFVVDRFLERQRFVPEKFWSIKLSIEMATQENNVNAQQIGSRAGSELNKAVEFHWDRNRLFHRTIAMAILEMCVEGLDDAVVTDVNGSRKSKRSPFPLSTVEMIKLASRKLRMTSAKAMEVAEKLYQQGYISYPRTETDKFTQTMDLRSIVVSLSQRAGTDWARYAAQLVTAGKFQWPKPGQHDDQAHPPIHPVKGAAKENFQKEEEYKLYELVTRHFLACCSADAVGQQTVVRVAVGGELFRATGLIILERNYLEVYYPYESWTGSEIPNFQIGSKPLVKSLLLHEGKTEPPQLLTEADLIDLMDKNGIGTDATMHEHIKTIQERKYAMTQERYFAPTPRGLALVKAFRAASVAGRFNDISKPTLRSRMESAMTAVARGTLSKEAVIVATTQDMRRIFEFISTHMHLLDAEILGQALPPSIS